MSYDTTDNSSRLEAASVLALVREIEGQIGRNELDRAHEACQRLLALHPACPEGWCLASRLAARAGRCSDALTYIDRALALRPGFAAWVLHKAQYLQMS